MISMDSVSSIVSADDGLAINERESTRSSGGSEEEAAVAAATSVKRTIRSLSVPKNERPPQPAQEREYFERLWTQNFERSEAQVNSFTDYIPIGTAARLNRIKGFSFARESTSSKLYAVFRLEIESIITEKQWTIYRRFHDFKQLAQQLKNEVVRFLFSISISISLNQKGLNGCCCLFVCL
jgi:hypothetical protein